MSGTVQMWRVHLPSLKVGDRVRTDLGDIDGLVQSIRDRGLLQPLVLDEDGRFVKIGRQVRYRTEDVDAWLAARTVATTDASSAPRLRRVQ